MCRPKRDGARERGRSRVGPSLRSRRSLQSGNAEGCDSSSRGHCGRAIAVCGDWPWPHRSKTMQVADLILPVFAVIVTGWLAGALGYVARDLSDALIHFAYNIAMPALLFLTIGQEPARSLLAWRF